MHWSTPSCFCVLSYPLCTSFDRLVNNAGGLCDDNRLGGRTRIHKITHSLFYFILFYFILYIYIYISPPIWLSWCSWSLSHRQLCLNLHSDISPLNYSSHLRHRLVADPDTRLAGEPGSPQCIEGKLSLRKHTVIMMPWSFTVRLHVPALMFFTSYWGWSGCLTAHTSLRPHPEQITFPLIDFFVLFLFLKSCANTWIEALRVGLRKI